MPAPLQQAAPPGYNNPGPRTLHLYDDSSFSQRRMNITDSDKATNLYTVSHKSSWSMFSSKPHMSITRVGGNSYQAENNGVIGTVTFHTISPTELIIHGRTVPLQQTSWVSRGRTFQSSATGTILTWKYDSVWGNSMTCSDETNQWLARYRSSKFSLSKGGVLELASPAIDGILLDEVVISALAVVEERKRTERAAGDAGDISGAVGG